MLFARRPSLRTRTRRAGPLALALAAGLALASASAVQAQQAGGAQGGNAGARNWVMQCGEAQGDTPRRCRVVQNIVLQETNQRLLTVVVEPREGAENHALVLALPHGVFLPAGASIAVDDGEPAALVIQTSDANGAYAGTAISDDLLASLKKGSRMTVAFKTAQRKDLAVPVSLIGFTAAYDQLN